MGLQFLAPDALQTIAYLLDYRDIVKLWMCGCALLNWKLSQGGVIRKVEYIRPSFEWPGIVSQFAKLRSLTVHSIYPEIISTIDAEKILSLPATIEEIDFKFRNDWKAFCEALSVRSTPFENLRIMDMSGRGADPTIHSMASENWQKLKNLKTLKIMASIALCLVEWYPENLPPALETLVYSCPTIPRILGEDGKVQTFPKSLTYLSLQVHDLPALWTRTLPHGLTHLEVYPSFCATGFEKWDLNRWGNFPAGLKTLKMNLFEHFGKTPVMTSFKISSLRGLDNAQKSENSEKERKEGEREGENNEIFIKMDPVLRSHFKISHLSLFLLSLPASLTSLSLNSLELPLESVSGQYRLPMTSPGRPLQAKLSDIVTLPRKLEYLNMNLPYEAGISSLDLIACLPNALTDIQAKIPHQLLEKVPRNLTDLSLSYIGVQDPPSHSSICDMFPHLQIIRIPIADPQWSAWISKSKTLRHLLVNQGPIKRNSVVSIANLLQLESIEVDLSEIFSSDEDFGLLPKNLKTICSGKGWTAFLGFNTDPRSLILPPKLTKLIAHSIVALNCEMEPLKVPQRDFGFWLKKDWFSFLPRTITHLDCQIYANKLVHYGTRNALADENEWPLLWRRLRSPLYKSTPNEEMRGLGDIPEEMFQERLGISELTELTFLALEIGYRETWPAFLVQLPPSVRELSIIADASVAPETPYAELFKFLPPSLTRLSLPINAVDLGHTTYKHLPKSLLTLQLRTRSVAGWWK